MNEIQEIVALSSELGFTQNTVATHLKVTDGYWYKIRSGRTPVTEDVLKKVREFRKKLRAFVAA